MQIFITEYEPESGKKKYQKEHQKGLSLLCYGLKERYHLLFSEEEIEAELGKREHGKPYLKRFPQIHLNISHSHGIAVCALSDYEVGIDVEKIAPFRTAVAGRILTEKEQEFLQMFDGAGREELFYRFWTLKESYLKLAGSGLTRDPREVAFTMEKNADDWQSGCSDNAVSCYQQKIKEEYMLAVCSLKAEETENVNVTWIVGRDIDWNGEQI